MNKRPFGKTGFMVSEFGFGALPIQRTGKNEAVRIIRSAYERGVNFFDTARGYTDSEEKLAAALSDVRREVIIATKSHCKTLEQLKKDFDLSLTTLKTDYIDIYQFHDPRYEFSEGVPAEMYEYLLQLKKQGVIKKIGVSAHMYTLALDHIGRGIFDTIQYPISMLASGLDFEVINKAKDAGMGILGMKGLSGGLITNIRAAAGFMMAHPEVQPIYGIQRMEELDEFLALYSEKIPYDDKLKAVIEKEKEELSGSFCRGCNYCAPCTVGLEIERYARLPYMLKRSPDKRYYNEKFAAEIERVNECIDCGACKSRCPYDLDCPSLMRAGLESFHEAYDKYKKENGI